jgi:hypothetical protein
MAVPLFWSSSLNWYSLQEEGTSGLMWNFNLGEMWGTHSRDFRLWSAGMWHSVVLYVVKSVSVQFAAFFISIEGSQTERVGDCVENGEWKHVKQDRCSQLETWMKARWKEWQ